MLQEEFQRNIDQLMNIIGQKPDNRAVLCSLLVALLFSGIMILTYRLVNQIHSYDAKFAVTLLTLALISTILMDLIQSNLALSLGMLGSLSIVRFRTNIHDPRDIGFIFWAMAIGIAASTRSYVIGMTGCTVLMAVMLLSKKDAQDSPLLLVIRGSSTDLDRLQRLLVSLNQSTIKAKNILTDSFEIVYEVRLPAAKENQLIENIFELGGIDSVNLLAKND